jgi:uncharacterized membrane protein YvlD (DUF360 family)
MSTLFSLNWKDLAKGVVMAALAAILLYFYQALTASGFSFTTIDWNALGQVGALAIVSYLLKNFFSTSDGKFAGLVG